MYSIATVLLVLCVASTISFLLQVVNFELDEEHGGAAGAKHGNYPPAELDATVVGDKADHVMWYVTAPTRCVAIA